MTLVRIYAALAVGMWLMACTGPAPDERPVLIPAPQKTIWGDGTYRLPERLQLGIADTVLIAAAGYVNEVLAPYGTVAVDRCDRGDIVLELDSAALPPEGYRLSVTHAGVRIGGGSYRGVVNGIATLRQLLPAKAGSGAKIPYAEIADRPAFGWRGVMLDVSRHFFDKEEIFTLLDQMARLKLNKFHWHLTDDQGWRIEIKKYPLLTQIGSRRAETLVGRYDKNKEGVYDGKPYGGFYTQEEIREIVSYAAERHIEVIPEIEMPGHGLAALTAYPWLGCTGGPYAVWTHWGISDDVYCAGKETTFEFIEKVLTEVLALFPSKLIHIGGDECPKGRWKACPLCQQRIREEGLKDEYQLQSYFIHRIERWMHAHGREIIGWDEILQGGISKTANIMSWNGSDPGIKAAQRGNPVIMTPKWYCYFDYSQTSDPERYEPLGNTRYVSVRQAYRLDPCDRLTLPDQKRIRGVQCNLWTEYIADIRHAQHMVLPRMAALAETGWANDRKDYNDFVRRIPALVAVYKAEGYNYAPYLFEGIE